jgi:F-type H+-transporting ATPase subunit gamma
VNLRILEARLRAWQSFRGVAHAARTLAASQVVRWSHQRTRAREHLTELLTVGHPADLDERPLVVAFGTDHGLCGGLNRVVTRSLEAHLGTVDPWLVVLLGTRLAEDRTVPEHWVTLPAPASPESAELVAERVVAFARSHLGRPHGKLHLIHGAGVDGAGVARIAVSTAPPSHAPTRLGPDPAALDDPARIEDRVRALTFRARITLAATEAAWTEANARLVSMTRAQTAADRRIDTQQRKLRSLRQEVITQEMLEVLGGRRSVRSRRAPAPVESGAAG